MDLEIMFGIKSTELCKIFWEMKQNVIDDYGHHLTQLKSEQIQERAALYAERVNQKGAPL